MAREWTAPMAFLGSLHLSKAGGWSPPRFVSAQWWNVQHNDLQVVTCRPGVCSLRECLPIISQEGNLKKPKGSKANKSQTPFYGTTKKWHCLLAGMPLCWLLNILTAILGELGGWTSQCAWFDHRECYTSALRPNTLNHSSQVSSTASAFCTSRENIHPMSA